MTEIIDQNGVVPGREIDEHLVQLAALRIRQGMIVNELDLEKLAEIAGVHIAQLSGRRGSRSIERNQGNIRR